MTTEPTAGAATRRLLEDQIADERERRGSLEARGASVITSGGVVVTLLVGVAAAFSDPQRRVTVSTAALSVLAPALVALVTAAVLSILVVLPRKYQGVDPIALARLTEERWWNASFGPTDRRTAEAQLVVLTSLRGVNRNKAIMLSAALGSEALGVLLLGVAAALVLGAR